MLITTRKEAINAGNTQYFTGKPCKYGHIAQRYTQSGTCTRCVLDAAAASRDESTRRYSPTREKLAAQRQAKMEDLASTRQAREDALKQIVEVRVPIYPHNLATVFGNAMALCLLEFPFLDKADIQPDPNPIRGTPNYRLKVPLQHAKLLSESVWKLWMEVPIEGLDKIQLRQQIAMQELEDEKYVPPFSWK